jgi:hypothetical protein
VRYERAVSATEEEQRPDRFLNLKFRDMAEHDNVVTRLNFFMAQLNKNSV